MDTEKAQSEEEDEGALGDSYVGGVDEEEYVDIRGSGENIDDYWARGWLSGFLEFRRFNVDGYGGREYKVFPTRYALKDFKLSKSQRRLLKVSQSLRTIIRPLRITDGKSKLYARYYERRHQQPDTKAFDKVYEYIKYYPSELTELCVFNDEKLIACSVFQVGNEAMYSDLAVWDVDEKAPGLGILTVLLEMLYGQKRGLKYYYLGHYFRKNPNYQYKTRFSGLELYDWEHDRWIAFHDPAAESLLSQKLVPDEDDDEFNIR